MDEIAAFLRQHDRFAAHNGITLVEMSAGRAVARMALQPYHQNGAGMAHGGAIFTLGDLALAAAANAHGTIAVGINVSIQYVKAAHTGTLTATARETSLGPRLATYTVDITDGEGDTVAIMQGMVYRKRDVLPVNNGQ
ncbi:MAG TPA: PaaI family thioesterase [Chloroflexi bacterium]|jgi:acyl-CoA thioesterase|nr:PaaI family thioesterase [Chloroflexota bacterium]